MSSINRTNRRYFMMAIGGTYIAKDSEIDIAVRCPVCGDSRVKQRSARLHLYNKNNKDFIGCFNGDCPVGNRTVYSFLRSFYPNLLNNYKRETFQSEIANIGTENDDVFASINAPDKKNSTEKMVNDWTTSEIATNENNENNVTTEDEPIRTSLESSKSDWMNSNIADMDGTNLCASSELSEVQTLDLSSYMTAVELNVDAMNYIRNRGIEYDSSLFGQWYYGHQDLKIKDTVYHITDSLVIPLYYNNEMYGFYSRNIRNKKFMTYMDDVNIGYKIAFWFNVNKEEPVYIFEGVFDAISINHKNVIALMGAKIPDARLNELTHPVFVLDNDVTGLKNSLQYAKAGKSVFVLPDEYKEKDMNELLLNNNGLDLKCLIDNNTYRGISAQVRIKSKL